MIAIAAFKPLKPAIVLESLVSVPSATPYSNFPGRFKQFQITVRNIGIFPVWLRQNDVAISDDSWLTNAAKGDSAYVAITSSNENMYTKLAAGESRLYDLVIHAEHQEFRLFVDVRDWRSRNAYEFLGQHSTGPETGGGPSNAPESQSQAF